MAEMRTRCAALFDSAVSDLTDIIDHKKIACKACKHGAPPITAYTAYHLDCVRKHFLRHHEVRRATLAASGLVNVCICCHLGTGD